MDIAFDCPNCGQHNLHDESYCGMNIECESCGKTIVVPMDGERVMPATPEEPTTRIGSGTLETRCPYCAEIIQAGAIKCKHCGEFLQSSRRITTSASAIRQPYIAPPRLWSPGVAAVLSLVIAGAGQMYKGRIREGFIWLFVIAVLYAIGFKLYGEDCETGMFFLLLPGAVHATCVFKAAQGDTTVEGG